jgi:two-component system, NarL family, nitrate/nitrite response regulator NarL
LDRTCNNEGGSELSQQTKRAPIILASDFPIFRDSFEAHCNKISEIELVACVRSGDEVVPLLESYRPKLVLLDLNLETDALCALLDNIHDGTDVRSLIMSEDLDTAYLIQLLRHGANGVVSRRTSLELFTKSITSVLAGEFWVSRAMIRDLVHQMRQTMPLQAAEASETPIPVGSNVATISRITGNSARAEDIPRFGLTRRETQIIGALVDGQTNKDIAKTFAISEYTVKHHLTSVYDKLGVYNRVELVLFAIAHGLCPTLA